MSQHKYQALDSLRGVAAMAVVLYHCHLLPSFFPAGYLAVDFFFVLSGFVLAHAYGEALSSGRITLRDFVVKRIVRLYPAALFGITLGGLLMLVKYLARPEYLAGHEGAALAAFIENALLLPNFTASPTPYDEIFPTNGAIWSLFFELVANGVWAVLLVRGWSLAMPIVVVSGVLVAAQVLDAGTGNLGWAKDNFLGGFARVGFGFFLGTILYRIRDTQRLPSANRLIVPAVSVVLMVIFMAATSAWAITLSTLLIMPALVHLAGRPNIVAWPAIIGRLSFPLYAVHLPVVLFVSAVHKTRFPTHSPVLFGIAAVVLSFAMAWFTDRFIDQPVQRRFKRRNASPTPGL